MRRDRLLALILILISVMGTAIVKDMKPHDEKIVFDGFRPQDMAVPLPKSNTPTATPTPDPMEEERKILWENLQDAEVLVVEMVIEEEYTAFLTAYCAEECGWNYWTSSGEYCHRSEWEDRYEASTCAVDLNYFPYGTYFYIPSEDRVYIAEDTGSGVKGYHIDTYQDCMDDVRYYETRYDTIYVVTFEEHYVRLGGTENDIE